MTSAPNEDGTARERDLPGGDLGIGGPAEDTADEPGAPTQPEGRPEEVDPAHGPVTDGATRGDLLDPGAR